MGWASSPTSSVLVVALVILALGIAFYWYEIRPSNIRRACEAYANSQDAYGEGESNNLYRMCVKKWDEAA